jgi:uncharacterized repeat protein (TIGR01451 family)
MSSKRTARSAGRRLRLEFLEAREVPDAGAPDIDPLPPDATIPVQMPVDPKPADPATDGVVVPDGNPDELIYTTSAVDGIPQGPAVDLAALATIDRLKPSLGDAVTVKVTVTNDGPVEATGVQVTAALPAGMTFVSASVGPSKYDPLTGIWDVGSLASKGKVVLTLKAKVTDVAPQSVGATITHSDQADDKAENNAATITVTPVLGALNLSKTVSTPAVAVGSTVVFTLAVGNAGPGTARGVTVTDTFGSGLAFAKVLTATHGSFNQVTGVWTIGALPAGTTAVLRLVMVVNKFARIESPASITGGTGFDPARSKVEATAAITGVRPNGMATWSYFAGPGFGLGTTPVPTPAKGSVLPSVPVTLFNGKTAITVPSLLQFLMATGFQFRAH